MKIACIGYGHVGAALGSRWAESGHQIVFGVRHPESEKVQAVVRRIADAKAMPLAEAAAWAEVILLATPWSAAEDALRQMGNVAGKIILDATNPFGERGQWAVGFHTSGAEMIQSWAQGAFVIKAFNSAGAASMLDPAYPLEPTMFYCGEDAGAKRIAAELIAQVGFEAVDCGALSSARYIEPLALLWVRLAYQEGMGTGIAFKLMKKENR